MGLREGKKRKVRENIQRAAVELFRERGYSKTRVREIIERVQISESTFFNYYATKDAVLNEWAHEKVIRALALANSGSYLSLREEIAERARQLAAEISEDRAFLATVWHRLRLAPPPENPLDGDNELEQFLSARQARGEISEQLPAEQFSSLITGIAMSTLSDWLLNRERQAENLETRLTRALDILFEGCAGQAARPQERLGNERWVQAGAR